jgi:ribosomal-protein-serine acetyltransferase
MQLPNQISDQLFVRPLRLEDAPTVFALLEVNRDHLDHWLRWSGWIKTLADCQAYIQRFQDKLAIGDGLHLGVWQQNYLIGGFVCHFINRESRKTEIGYWLAANQVGKGVITLVCSSLISYLITDEQMHRVEIQAAVDNLKSRAVAERLGFTFEGIKRESEWLMTSYRDHAMYALLDREWRQKPPGLA